MRRWFRRVSALVAIASFAATTPAFAIEYTTGYRYDASHRLRAEIDPDPDGASPWAYPAVRYTWSDDGQLVQIEKGVLSSWQSESIAPSAWGTAFTVEQQTTYSYDVRGLPTDARVTAGGVVQSVTQFSYDQSGRLSCTAVRMNLAAIPAVGSDACQLSTALGLAQGNDGPDRITKNIYDAANQVVQVVKGSGVTTANGFPTTLQQAYATYDYSPNGKQTVIVDANGNRAEMRYNAFDRKNCWIFPSKTLPSGFNPATQATALATSVAPVSDCSTSGDFESFTYDANGNLYDWRRRNGYVISYRYDALDRRNLKTASRLPAVTYGYDLLGHLLSATFTGSGVGVSYSYDNAGRLQNLTDTTGGASLQLGYLYDPNSNRIRVTHPDGQYFTYDYDALNRLKGINENGTTALVTIAYYDTGERKALTRAGGAVTNYGYDGISRLTSLAHTFTNGSGNVTIGFPTYNAASQIAQRTLSNDSYAYVDTPAFTRPYSVNGLNQYTQTGPAGAPTSTFSYGSNANLASSTDTASGITTNYSYDDENKLIGASGGKTAALSYDPNGRLNTTGPTSASATRLLYDGEALVAEYDSSGNLLRRYIHGPGVDEPLVWYEGAGVGSPNRRFLHADQQGSIIAVSDSSGNLIRSDTYDEYGIPGGANSTLANQRFAYTGQILIPELGLYHYKARAYSPILGRFMQTDPVGYKDQINLYDYVGDDPLNRGDPTGTACVPDPLCQKPAPIAGNAQNYGGVKGAEHARVSNQIAQQAAETKGVARVYLNQELKTATGGAINSKLRPDVTVVMNDGRVVPIEVPSGKQTAAFFKTKYAGLVGRTSGRFTLADPVLSTEMAVTARELAYVENEELSGRSRSGTIESFGARLANFLGIFSFGVHLYRQQEEIRQNNMYCALNPCFNPNVI